MVPASPQAVSTLAVVRAAVTAALRLAAALAANGDRDPAITMITDPELCALPSGESSESGSHLASAARAADGEPARALAVAGRARAGGLVGPVDGDACPGRDRVLTLIAGVAASRGLVTEAAAAVAGIEPTHRSLGPAWRRVAALLDEHQLRAAASAYLTARTPPMARKDVLPLS